MKKTNKKLARETLATLSPDVLENVNGGNLTGPIMHGRRR